MDGPLRNLLVQKWGDSHVKDIYRPFEKIFNLEETVYPKLMLEFFCTIKYKKKLGRRGLDDEDFMKFRLGGVDRCLSVRTFTAALGIYTQEEMDKPLFYDYIGGGRALGYDTVQESSEWREIGNKKWASSKRVVNEIVDPMIRILHNFLAYSVTQTGASKEKVNSNAL